MTEVIPEIITILCFLALIVVLFNEKTDYLTYSFVFIIIAGVSTAIYYPDTRSIDFYVDLIEWEVVFFLIGMFTIVEVLNEKMIFQEISRVIVKKYKNSPRKLFYVICIISTLSATILEDLSVAIIFGPIIVIACREIKINPTPFLLGMTICINLASTLTPFGSAENVLIFNAMNLTFVWFLKNFSLYFITATIVTLISLDRFILKHYPSGNYVSACEEHLDLAVVQGVQRIGVENRAHGIDVAEGVQSINSAEKASGTIVTSEDRAEEPVVNDLNLHIFYRDNPTDIRKIENFQIDPVVFKKNIIGLIIFVFLIVSINNLFLPSILGALIFIFLNPVNNYGIQYSNMKKPSISYYMKKVDYKLVYFFICLFVLVGLMERNGTIEVLESFIENMDISSIFLTSIIILLLTSVLSGFMDNAPVTIIFLPIIQILIAHSGFDSTPIIIAFILGINLGGNFLPQGSACDMMTLEIAKENCVEGFTYKKLFKVGGLFAMIHILLGIGYLWFVINFLI